MMIATAYIAIGILFFLISMKLAMRAVEWRNHSFLAAVLAAWCSATWPAYLLAMCLIALFAVIGRLFAGKPLVKSSEINFILNRKPDESKTEFTERGTYYKIQYFYPGSDTPNEALARFEIVSGRKYWFNRIGILINWHRGIRVIRNVNGALIAASGDFALLAEKARQAEIQSGKFYEKWLEKNPAPSKKSNQEPIGASGKRRNGR